MKKVQSKNIRLSDDARRVAWMFEDGGCLNLLAVLETLRQEVGDVKDVVERCIRATTELIEKQLARLVRCSLNGMEQTWPEDGAKESKPERAIRVYFEPELSGNPARIEIRGEIELQIDQSKRHLIYGSGPSKD
ncbi:hypothetical protein ANRL2_01022 [Anaerolineae bacterium]|nr:hypothetical protein ANRL2_01022 [Anaerolineae bacterium]